LNSLPPTNFPAAGPNLTPLIFLFIGGFLVLAFGRLIGSTTVQVAGVVMVIVATFAVPAMAFLVH
jgi:hypothetical protein